ncbi:MAG: hypothetical protein O7A09_01790 [Proteobacteria bacterium]|nr:hypothetical protein [Pseudomonadota bacterium]
MEPPGRRLVLDYQQSVLHMGLAATGLALFGWGAFLRRSGRSERYRRTRRGALLALAALSYSSFYYFFQFHHPHGLKAEDVYSYYIGSKYAPELGYFGLYECTLTALVENGTASLDEIQWVRDLRTLRVIRPRQAWVRGKRCRDQSFEPARWAEFQRDVTWFRERMRDADFAHLMTDHGYQPGPVWTAMARPLSSLAPTEDAGPTLLSRLDRVVVLAVFLVVAWAFGLEAACLVAIVWGTGFLWRYGWIGDNYLRQMWMASALSGICLARKGMHGGAGALLTFSALLRLFPAVFALGYVLQAALRGWRERSIPPNAVRFAIGAGIAGVVLVAASVGIADRGVAIYGEFYQKISRFEASPATNKVGLPVLANSLLTRAAGEGDEPPLWAVVGVQGARWALVAALLWLLGRALARAQPWEGAALGFTLVPVLTQPTNYYYTFVLAAALLATRRPRIALFLLGASVAWSANGLVFYREQAGFVGASLIALVFCAALLWEMQRPAASSSAAR